MCNQCRARNDDPRTHAFVNAGILEVLSTIEAAKLQRGETGWVMCTAVGDGPAAAASAAVMTISDPAVVEARVRHVRLCMN